MSKDSTYFMTKREKICMEILRDLIRANTPYIRKQTGTFNTGYFDLVKLSVDMTDELLIRLKIESEKMKKL